MDAVGVCLSPLSPLCHNLVFDQWVTLFPFFWCDRLTSSRVSTTTCGPRYILWVSSQLARSLSLICSLVWLSMLTTKWAKRESISFSHTAKCNGSRQWKKYWQFTRKSNWPVTDSDNNDSAAGVTFAVTPVTAATAVTITVVVVTVVLMHVCVCCVCCVCCVLCAGAFHGLLTGFDKSCMMLSIGDTSIWQ